MKDITGKEQPHYVVMDKNTGKKYITSESNLRKNLGEKVRVVSKEGDKDFKKKIVAKEG